MMDPTRPDRAGDAASTSKAVPLSYAAAAIINVLFIKGLAVHFDVAVFGAIVAALSLTLAATFSTLTMQALAAASASARYLKGLTAGFTARVERDASLLIGGAIALSVALYFVEGVPTALRLPSASYAASVPLLAATAILFGIATGTVLGSGRERAFAALVVMEPSLRCVVTVVFLSLGVGGFSPLLAMLASTTAAVLVSRRVLPSVVGDDPAPSPKEVLIRQRLPLQPFAKAASLLALFCYGLLVFIDVPVVRFLLDAEEAGRYAGLATVNRFLLLLPFPIALLVVARVRQRINRREPSHPELFRGLAIFAVPTAIALLLIDLFAPRILGLFLDYDKYGGLWVDFPRYAIAAALFGAAQLVLFYGIAAGRISLAVLPLVAAVLQVVLLAENGNSVGNCVTVMQTMAILFLIVLTVVVLAPLLWSRSRPRAR